MMKLKTYSFGVLLCTLIGALATWVATYVPIGAVATAIIFGILIGNLTTLKSSFTPGISFSEKHILSVAIALLGVKLNFQILSELGYKSILLVVCALGLTLVTSLLLAKLLKFDRKFALLLGIGNGVCGSSAIAATEKIMGTSEEEVGLSVAIVNFLGTLGIFLLPFIGKFVLGLSDVNAGVLAGNTLQAVGQVVAAGFSISDSAGQIATIIKMTRILMLFPLVLILIFVFSGNKIRGQQKVKQPPVPLFIIGFVLFSLVPSLNLLPVEQIKILGHISHYALVIAMAGIGLKIKFQSILRDGKSALTIGALIFTVQILFSSVAVYVFY